MLIRARRKRQDYEADNELDGHGAGVVIYKALQNTQQEANLEVR